MSPEAANILDQLGKVTVELPAGYGTLPAKGHIFKSGSYGFYGAGKIECDGVKYQVSVNVTAIGTKGTFGFDEDGNILG